MKQTIQKLERPDIILIEFVKMGEEEGKKEGRRLGRREGKLELLIWQFEYRLNRALTDAERDEIKRRTRTLGPERVGHAVIDLGPRKLAAWLADPKAK